MEISYQLQWPARPASPAPQHRPPLLSTTKATHTEFPSCPPCQFFITPNSDGWPYKMDDPGSAQPCLCMGTTLFCTLSKLTQQRLGWRMANCSARLLSLQNFCTLSLYDKGNRSVPRHGYHCAFSKEPQDWEWRTLSPFVRPRRTFWVFCNRGLHVVLLKLCVSCHQVPDPKTAKGPMFVNALPLFFFSPVLEEKNVRAMSTAWNLRSLSWLWLSALIRSSKLRESSSRTWQATAPLQ